MSRTQARLRILGRLIASVRSQRGMTQTQFGDQMEWSRSTVARLEAGDRETLPNEETMNKIAYVLGLDVESIHTAIRGDEKMTAAEHLEGIRYAAIVALADLEHMNQKFGLMRTKMEETVRRVDEALAADPESRK